MYPVQRTLRWAMQASTRVGIWACLVLGLNAQALALTELLIARGAALAFALATRAQLLAGRAHWGAALADLQRLCMLTDAAPAYFNLGFVAAQLGMHSEAGAAFERALALSPELDQAWYGLGLLHAAQGDWPAAALALEHSTRLQPLCPHGWYRLAHVHAAAQQPAQAARVIEHLSGFEPQVARQLRQELAL